ncbi:MAG: sugar transferase [Bacteroidales bacterium]|nr:sugar transferase [Bacteroidales bacterium]
MINGYLYIGINEDFIRHLNNELDNKLSVVADHLKAIELLSDRKPGESWIIFVQKGSEKSDYSRIRYLRKLYKKHVIVIVGNASSKEAQIEYLKSGMDTMISEQVTSMDLKCIISVLSVYREKEKSQEQKECKTEVKRFVLPFWKRTFDVVFASGAILFLSPLFLLVSIAIRLESKGNLVYKSKRVGSNYKVFDFWKFRSMYIDADNRLKEFQQLNKYQSSAQSEITKAPDKTEMADTLLVADDFVISEKKYLATRRVKQKNTFVKFENDPRITKVGRFIRKYSIDELPQLFNILVGDMSVVGNRPLPLYEAELLTTDEDIDRFLAPAGLTGLWQVRRRGQEGSMSASDRKKLDVYYAKHFSFLLDIKIILATFTAFIQKENM